MSLINCPECKNQVSSNAPTCPHCGNPIAEAAGSKAAGAPLTTVQETSKRLKIHIIFSSIIFWIGIIWMAVALNDMNSGKEGSYIPAIILFVGGVLYVITRFRIWWHHK